uniref:Uncharacterized protein n=1 Tax=Opuntia streptacantha TaxID=393608 RepID=A0A7C9D5Q5_OPUST
MKSPSLDPTAMAGIKWASPTKPSPLDAPLARIIPTPPAFLTTRPLATRGLLPLSQMTILPLTSFGLREFSIQRDTDRMPVRPGYTTGYIFPSSASPAYRDTPVIFFPFPRTTSAGKFLSIVLAPTVVIHGARFVTDMLFGPSLPAEEDTNTPLETAPYDPIAIGSR